MFSCSDTLFICCVPLPILERNAAKECLRIEADMKTVDVACSIHLRNPRKHNVRLEKKKTLAKDQLKYGVLVKQISEASELKLKYS